MNQTKREIVVLAIFLAGLVTAFGGLTWRLYDLKVNQKNTFEDRSKRQVTSFDLEQPRRGMILDAKGRVLAASSQIYNAFVEPRRLQSYPDQILVAAGQLQEILQISGPDICEKIENSRNPGYLKLKSEITPDERESIYEARRELPALGVETNWQRSYPAGNLTGHILGFVGADNTGLTGIELKYNDTLAGTPGKNVFVVDVSRREIASHTTQSYEAIDGKSLVLTIDSVIQRFVHEALKKQWEEYEAESAVAMVMDPWTGGILAMVSLPDYDPLNFSKTPQDQMRNRVLTDPYEPGSIFKPLVATIGLECGKIGYTEKFDCEDGFWSKYGGIGEFGNHKYGMMDVRDIIIHSSNVGMAKIGLKMGQQNLYDGLKMFGFSSRTGVDLPGEEPGLVWSLRKWSSYSVTRIPFGHEVLVTPLQVCRAYCILANGGYVIKPHIVRAIVDNKGNIIEDKQPVIGTGYILQKDIAEWMVQKALADVVNEGTGDQAQLDGYQAWGKTGTANIAVDGQYDWKNYVASFVGGAPAKDPAVVVLVSIRKPNRSLGKGYSGGRVAAPVVGEILEKTLTYLKVPKEMSMDQQVALQ